MDHETSFPRFTERRRRHSPVFTAQILAECQQPAVLLASVALRHGINQTLIYTWRRAMKSAPQDAFLRLPSPLSAPGSEMSVKATIAAATRRIRPRD